MHPVTFYQVAVYHLSSSVQQVQNNPDSSSQKIGRIFATEHEGKGFVRRVVSLADAKIMESGIQNLQETLDELFRGKAVYEYASGQKKFTGTFLAGMPFCGKIEYEGGEFFEELPFWPSL